MRRLQVLACVALTVIVFSPLGLAKAAETFPDKEIRIIAASGAGGSIDRMSRAVQKYMPKILGQQVLVENRQGAGGKIALSYLLSKPQDGYHIFAYHQPGVTQIIKKNPGIIKLEDMAFINFGWSDPSILVASKKLGWKGLDDMIKAVKANPGKYSFAAASPNSGSTVMTRMLFDKLGLDVKIVPYGGSGATQASIRGGHTDMTAGGTDGAVELKDVCDPIGVFWDEPIAVWPEAKTINGQLKPYGIQLPPGGSFRGFAVMKEFKDKYPERWNILVDAFKKLHEDPEYQDFCEKSFIGNEWMGPEKSEAFAREIDAVFR